MVILAEANGLDVTVAVIAFLGVLVSAIASVRAARQAGKARTEAAAVNRAVNNRPEGDPSLYDLVRSQGFKLDDLKATQDRQAVKVEQLGTKVANIEGYLDRPWWRR